MAIQTPHYDLPFRFLGSGGVNGPALVEQDSTEEIVNSVVSVMRYTQGQCDDDPELGIPDSLFSTNLDVRELETVINDQEKRAQTVLEEQPIGSDIGLRELAAQANIQLESSEG